MDSELLLRQLGTFPFSTAVRLIDAMTDRTVRFDDASVLQLIENLRRCNHKGYMSDLRALRFMQLGIIPAIFDLKAAIEVKCDSTKYSICGRTIDSKFSQPNPRCVRLEQFKTIPVEPEKLGKNTSRHEVLKTLRSVTRLADAFEFAWLVEFPELIPVLFPQVHAKSRRDLYIFGGFAIYDSENRTSLYPALLYKGPGNGAMDFISGWEYTDIDDGDMTEGFDSVHMVSIE